MFQQAVSGDGQIFTGRVLEETASCGCAVREQEAWGE